MLISAPAQIAIAVADTRQLTGHGIGGANVGEKLGCRSLLTSSSGAHCLAITAVLGRIDAHAWTTHEIHLAGALATEAGCAIATARALAVTRELRARQLALPAPLEQPEKPEPVVKRRQLEQATAEFMATVSHELRTPLANILGYVEILRDLDAGPLLPEQLRLLAVVERNGTRLLSLIENLLTAKVVGQAYEVDLAPIDVVDLVKRARKKLLPTVARAGLRLDVTVDAELPPLNGDAAQLERALLNIVGNSVKFTPNAGNIALRVDMTRDGSARFAVTDDGLGVPRAERDQLFQAFFRSSISQQRATDGLGLGLYIVKLIVDGHGGQVGATSVPDEGTTVWFTIPTLAPSDP